MVIIVEGQNNLDWKGYLEVIWSSLLLRAGLTSDKGQVFHWKSAEKEIAPLLWSVCSCANCSCVNIFLMFNQCFPCSSLRLLLSVLELCASEKSGFLFPYSPSLGRGSLQLGDPSPHSSLLQAQQAQVLSPLLMEQVLQPLTTVKGSSPESVVDWPQLCCIWVPKKDQVLQMHLPECPADGHHHLPHVQALLLHHTVWSPSITTRVYCWLLSILPPTRTTIPFSSSLHQ